MKGRNVFSRTGGVVPGRSAFDLSYDKKFTCDMGQLIPIMCDEVIPGDIFEIGLDLVVRFQPLVAPVLHEINAYVHYYFVPNRILWPMTDDTGDNWESFITGGFDGDNEAVLPRWSPTNTDLGSLWDFLGLPTGVNPVGALPLDFPRRAYNKIYNDYYRDETLQDEVDLASEVILNRAWEKDYFTSSLPWQQRGTAPSLPITGTSPAVFDFPGGSQSIGLIGPSPSEGSTGPHVLASTKAVGTTTATILGNSSDAWTNEQLRLIATTSFAQFLTQHNVVDLSDATTFNVADLRLAFSIQRWMERNARSGARYTESLRAHFGVAPRDERLQRPEYIGGTFSPVIVSEVLQTGSTDTTSPQGNMAGHGLVADRQYVAKYRAVEHGWIMGIMSIMPKPAYQQGIDRQYLRRTRYDYYWPEFGNLSEQAIEDAEIYAQGTEALNRHIFGYQGRYDEMRVKRSQVCSEMRTVFDYWHLGREFASAPALNSAFITCVPRKDIFAVPSSPGLLINAANRIKAIRPIPYMSQPGLIDHDAR